MVGNINFRGSRELFHFTQITMTGISLISIALLSSAIPQHAHRPAALDR